VPSEDLVVDDSDDVVVVVFVFVFQILQDSQLDSSLVLEPFLVPDDFDCNHLLLLVVKALQRLAKTTAANFFKDFVAECKMVFHHDLVISALVVIAKVVLMQG
jgi:hypothetical protein